MGYEADNEKEEKSASKLLRPTKELFYAHGAQSMSSQQKQAQYRPKVNDKDPETIEREFEAMSRKFMLQPDRGA